MRLMNFLSILLCLFATSLVRAATPVDDAGLPRPTPEQAAWQDLELGLLYHFDIPVFTDGGEGDWQRQGHLDPSVYNPPKLNTDQWLEAAKAMGAGYTVTEGQRVRQYVIEGLVGDRWTELARGQSIGHKRIERFHPIEVTKVRFRATEAVADPVIRKLAVYHVEPTARQKAATAKPSGWGVRQVLIADPKLPRVLLIGDSILNGYHAKAAELLRGKLSLDVWVTPKHIGSGDLPADMKAILAEHAYDVILFNDIALHAWEPGRIPEGKYEPLMRAHLANFRKFAPKATLIFASTTPMTTKTRPIAVDPEFNPVIVGRNQIATRIMAENHIPVADYHGILATKLDLAAGDRFHWTKPAYDLLAQCAVAQIEHALTASTGQKRAGSRSQP